MKITDRIDSAIATFENPRIPFGNYLLIFFSAVSLRTFLEIFSDKAKISFELYSISQQLYYLQWIGLALTFAHYFLFWISLCLTASIILHLVAKQPLTHTFRAVMTFYLIILITPLFDLITTGGAGNPIRYVYPKNLAEFLLIPKGLTPGIVCTSSTGLMLSFLYAWAKTKNPLKGLAASAGVYAALMSLAILPALLRSAHPMPLIMVLLLAVTAQLLFILYRARKAYFIDLVKHVRWVDFAYFQSFFFLGIMITGRPSAILTIEKLASLCLALLATWLAWCASVMFLDLSQEGRRQIIPLAHHQALAKYTMFLAMACAAGVSFPVFFFVFLIVGNTLLYSMPPLRLARLPIISKVLLSLNLLIMTLAGFLCAGGQILKFPGPLAWYIMLFVTLTLNYRDIHQAHTNAQHAPALRPGLLSIRAAKLILGTVCILSSCALSLLFLDLRLLFPLGLLGVLQFFFIARKQYHPGIVSLTQCAQIVLLLAYLALYGSPF